MQPPEKPGNEKERLQALCDLEILDTTEEERFDRLTRVAKRHFGVAIALVSLVDSQRQWFKSHQGLEAQETPRNISFCGHAILGEPIFQVPDTWADPRFADNPLVTGPPFIRFYAGAPIHAPSGERVGTLCIIDDHPQAFSEDELTVLRDLADAVETELEREELAHSQAQLQAREQELQSVLDAAADAIVIIDAHGIIRTFNPAAETIFGYTSAEIVGDKVNRLMPADYAREHDAYMQRYLATGEQRVIGRRREVTAQHKDGTNFAVDIAISELALDDERMFTGIIRDISERKEAEEERDRLLKILEASPDFISMSEADGTVLYVNSGGRRLLGLPSNPEYRDELVPQAIQEQETAGEWGHPEWAARKIQEQGIPTAMAEGFWEDETALIDANGREIPVSQLILAHRDPSGAVTHLSTIMRDISRHKTLEDRLERRQAALQGLQAITADPEPSRADKIDALLRLGADYFSLPYGILSRVEGDDYWIQQAVSPDGALAAGQHFDLGVTYCTHTLAAGGPTGFPHVAASTINDHPCYRTQGMEAYLGTPIQVEGRVYGTLNFSAPEPRAAFSDFEWGLLELMGQWISGELTQGAYREAVEASNAELEQFAYAISHDLKEPLRSITGYLNLLRRRFDDQLPEKAAGYVAAAEEGGARMGRMIDALLAYSRIKRMGEAFEPVALDEALEGALQNLASVRDEAGASIEADPLPTVAGDKGQLVRLFQNLLGNALKYRDPERAPIISVRASDRGSAWEIAVADNGIGIDPTQAHRVFQVFQRLQTRGSYEGTGAGLALVQRIVERHGGQIWVESAGQGQGSTFRFTLPKGGLEANKANG